MKINDAMAIIVSECPGEFRSSKLGKVATNKKGQVNLPTFCLAPMLCLVIKCCHRIDMTYFLSLIFFVLSFLLLNSTLLFNSTFCKSLRVYTQSRHEVHCLCLHRCKQCVLLSK